MIVGVTARVTLRHADAIVRPAVLAASEAVERVFCKIILVHNARHHDRDVPAADGPFDHDLNHTYRSAACAQNNTTFNPFVPGPVHPAAK